MYRYGRRMPRATERQPERGDARTRLLEAARESIRTKGFAATSVDDLCKAAGVTKPDGADGAGAHPQILYA